MDQILKPKTDKIHFNVEIDVEKLISETENQMIAVIANQVAEMMRNNYESIVAEFEDRLAEANSYIDVLNKRVTQLENIVNDKDQQFVPQEYISPQKAPQAQTSWKITTLSEEQMQEIFSYSDKHKKKGDWIYYTYPLNESKAYLYRVRPNGTDNEKILPMKIYASSAYNWDVKTDCIEFKDENYNDRRMPIPPEPPQKAKPALSKQELKYILSHPSCYKKEGDWIYSVDPDAGKYSYLYKCRLDGTENKKLLDFKIDTSREWIVKEGKIKVTDQDGKTRNFKINNQ